MSDVHMTGEGYCARCGAWVPMRFNGLCDECDRWLEWEYGFGKQNSQINAPKEGVKTPCDVQISKSG